MSPVSAAPSFFFNLAGQGQLSVRVSPLVVAAIFDAYQRRPTGASRAVGAIMGRISGNTVEVTEAFAVPISEDVALDKDHYRSALALFKRSATVKSGVPTESLIGWFSTGDSIEQEWAMQHMFFSTPAESRFVGSSVLPSPLLLVVDPTREDNNFNLKAFISAPTAGAETLMQFHQIPTELLATQNWADALGYLASHGSVIGKAKDRKHDLTAEEFIRDLEQAQSVPVNQETLSEIIACVSLAEAAEKQLVAALKN